MFKLLLRSYVLIVLMALVAWPAIAFGIGLQPTTVEMTVVPGDRNRQVVNIANVHTEQTISLTLGLADWSLDEDGQIRLAPPGEDAKSSAADWARFSPAFITLKPGESEQIIVDMSTPSRLKRSGDYRFALLASTILPEERSGQSGVWKKYQIATLFYLTTGPAASEPEITQSQILTDEDGKTTLELQIENKGNAHARLNGYIEFDNASKSAPLEIGNLVVLDQGRRNYVTRLPEGVTEDARINITLSNSFAPQANGGTMPLPPYRVGSSLRVTSVQDVSDSNVTPFP